MKMPKISGFKIMSSDMKVTISEHGPDDLDKCRKLIEGTKNIIHFQFDEGSSEPENEDPSGPEQEEGNEMTYFYRKLSKPFMGWLSDDDYRQYEVFECGDDGSLDRVYRFSTDAMLTFYRVFRPTLLTGAVYAKPAVLLGK
jgi:hypothetical protein